MPPYPHPVLSSLTVGIVGSLSKTWLNLCCSTRVVGTEHLYNAWKEENRTKRGLITVSNHVSVLDDPLMWGILPMWSFFSNRHSRWTLGARDIMFTNPVHSAFFRNGKVVDTIRGAGLYQDAIDFAIQRIREGEWLHIFPQGFVRQQTLEPPVGRLKWGIGRILAECGDDMPTVIPVWINGFDQIMPEDRKAPWRYLPKLGAQIRITFGDPHETALALREARDAWRQERPAGVSDPKSLQTHHAELTAIIERSIDSLGHKARNLTDK